MRKIIVLFLAPLLSFNFIADWQPVQLDNRVTIQFPATPTEKEMSGNKVWIADMNETSRCMAMVMDFSQMGFDSAQIADEFSQEGALESFRDQVLSSMGDVTLLSEKNTTTSGYKTMEYVIDLKKDTMQLSYVHNKNIIVGAKMYVLNYYDISNHAKSEAREHFFNSFKVN